MPLSSAHWEFGRGIIVNATRVHILSFPIVNPEQEPGGVTQVINWRPDQLSSFTIPWEAKMIQYVSKPEPYIAIIGPMGDVFLSTPQGNAEELIDETDRGPNARGVIRDAKLIGKHLYSVGMGRQVYRREKNGQWMHIDKDMFPDKPIPDIVGFCCIDGYNEDEIYVAGWRGEIWWYDGRKWTAIDSPTNMKLERIICAPDGYVYAMGQSAVVLRGRKNTWRQIDHGETDQQFWGSSWFNDHLWMSTDSGLYRLNNIDAIEKVDIGIEGKFTYRWLDSIDEALWSFGPNHICYSIDGEKWSQVIFD